MNTCLDSPCRNPLTNHGLRETRGGSDFLAYIAFGQDDDPDATDYLLPLGPKQWETLKDLVDETFRHMQTYLDRLPKEDEDGDEEE